MFIQTQQLADLSHGTSRSHSNNSRVTTPHNNRNKAQTSNSVDPTSYKILAKYAPDYDHGKQTQCPDDNNSFQHSTTGGDDQETGLAFQRSDLYSQSVITSSQPSLQNIQAQQQPYPPLQTQMPMTPSYRSMYNFEVQQHPQTTRNQLYTHSFQDSIVYMDQSNGAQYYHPNEIIPPQQYILQPQVQVVQPQLDMNQLQYLAQMIVQHQQQIQNESFASQMTAQPQTLDYQPQMMSQTFDNRSQKTMRSIHTQNYDQNQLNFIRNQNNTLDYMSQYSAQQRQCNSGSRMSAYDRQRYLSHQNDVTVMTIATKQAQESHFKENFTGICDIEIKNTQSQTELQGLPRNEKSDQKKDKYAIKTQPRKPDFSKSQSHSKPQRSTLKNLDLVKDLNSGIKMGENSAVYSTPRTNNERKPFNQIQNNNYQQTEHHQIRKSDSKKQFAATVAVANQIKKITVEQKKQIEKTSQSNRKPRPSTGRSARTVFQQVQRPVMQSEFELNNRSIINTTNNFTPSEDPQSSHQIDNNQYVMAMFDQCEVSSMQMLEPAIIHSTRKPETFIFDSSTKKPEQIFDQIEPIANWVYSREAELEKVEHIQNLKQQNYKDPDSLIEFQNIEQILQSEQKQTQKEDSVREDEPLITVQQVDSENKQELTLDIQNSVNEPSMFDELEALRQQRDAQQILIENLKDQVHLVEERAYVLQQLNEDLMKQLDALTDKEVTQKSVQTDCWVFRVKKADFGCQKSEFEDDFLLNGEEEFCHLTPKKYMFQSMQLENQSILDATERLREKAQDLKVKGLKRCQEFQMVFYAKYHNNQDMNGHLIDRIDSHEGKIINKYMNKTEVIHDSGLKREYFHDGYSVIYFENGDVKQTYPDGRNVYLFCEQYITQTELPNGDKIILFRNGQLEKYYTDGRKEIYFIDGRRKFIDSQGKEELIIV